MGNDTSQCGASVNYPAPTTNGNCGTVTCTPAPGSFFPKGTTTVNCSESGGSSCSFTVTVNDTQPPTVTCPANMNATAQVGQNCAVVNYTTPTASDNCSGATVNCSPAPGTCFPLGTTTVTCTATDASQNTGTCTFTVTVTQQVCAITCPANITKSNDPNQCGAVVTYTTPTPPEGCGTVTCAPVSGSVFAKGTTTVTCSVAGGSGCSFTVTVNDTQAPTVTCPGNVVATTDTGQCSAVITYANATANDNCGGTLTPTCAPASGSSFSKGVTTVTCSATDGSNNTGSCSFTVTVNDNQNPTVTCPPPVVVSTTSGRCDAVVIYTTPTANDNCPGATVACNPASGSTFAKGTTTVTCTASDAAGNTGSCSFTVTVNDNEQPSITCPNNISASGAGCAVVNYNAPAVSDNCPGVGAPTCNPASGSCFPQGTTTVTCSVKDASKNSNSCSFTVTVTPCTGITCPANITRANDANQCGAVVSFFATGSESCGNITCSPASGSFFPVGTTTVSCTSAAGPGCSFTVTVQDTQPPSITCPSSVTSVTPVIGGGSAIVTYPNPTVSDNCPGVTSSCNPPSGSTFPVGCTTVTCTTTDASGNTASCSFQVCVFNICLQDDSNADNRILINSATGDYRFCCNGMTFTGRGKMTIQGSTFTLEHNAIDRRVRASVTGSSRTGNASLQSPPGRLRCNIADGNTDNNTTCGTCR